MNTRPPLLLMHYEQPAVEVIRVTELDNAGLHALNDAFATLVSEQSWPWVISALDHRLCRRARSQS